MDKLQMQSKNLVDENIDFIAKRFPNCVTEAMDENGKLTKLVDFDLLKQELSKDIVEGNDERYTLNWAGKKQAVLTANAPISKTLRPIINDEKVATGKDSAGNPYMSTGSVGKDGTPNKFDSQNLYIEGDNLDVLKLLRETYLGKVKMIYIDPPYNTGHDFVYKDNFATSSEDYLQASKSYDEQGNRMFQNTDTNGRFHSDWLSMMYSRLRLAKDLLANDGALFISIDDNEQTNLKKLCDNVFGEDNFVGCIAVKGNPRGRQSSLYLAQVHDYLMVYRKTYNLDLVGFDISDEDIKKRFNKKDENGESYEEWELRKRGADSRREDSPNLWFPIYYNEQLNDISLEKKETYNICIIPKLSDGNDGRWRWSKEKVIREKNKLYVRKNSKGVYNIYEKKLVEEKSKQLAPTIWDYANVNTELGTKLLKQLFNNRAYFEFPKPIGLIERIIEMFDDKNLTALDFFSGSATTAHAIMRLNAEDGGKRKFICVQLPENTEESSDAYKDGYKNICEIGKERIRRAGKKILEDKIIEKMDAKTGLPFIKVVQENDAFKNEVVNKEVNLKQEILKDLDIGFRVLKLDDSCMKNVYYNPHDLKQDLLTQLEDNIKEDRTPEDLLFQVMLDMGVLLSTKITKRKIEDKAIYIVDNEPDFEEPNLICCFEKDLTDSVVKEIAKLKPRYAVFRDSSMSSDSVAVNFDQIFETYSHTTTRRII